MPPFDAPARSQPDPVVSDRVRARLDALLAESPPRRAHAPDPEATVRRETVATQGASAAAGRPGLARREFTRRHLVVVAAIVGLGVLVAVYALARARAVPVEPVVVQSAAPTATVGATPSPSTVSLRVHVLGAVRRPGVYALAAGARILDAVEAAGGLTDQARPGELNLAAPVADGQQVLVGDVRRPGGEVRPAGAGASSGAGAAPAATPGHAKLNLNTATVDQLDALPGVGPVTAQKIIDWRTAHQRFNKVAELQEVPGIGPKSYADLEPLVTV